MVIGQGTLFEEPPVAADVSADAIELRGRGMWEFPKGESDVARALRTARLDWKVEMRPMYFRNGEGGEVVSSSFAVVRKDMDSQLGTATERYQCIQNEEAARLFEPLLETGKYVVDAAGCTASNRVWMTVRSSRELDVTGRGDQVVSRLIGHWKHGGDSSVRFQYLPMRVVCSNMIQRATRGVSGLTIRHYGNVMSSMSDVRQVFNLIEQYEAEDIDAMMRMVKKPITDVRGYFSSLVAAPKREDYQTEQSYTRAVEKRDNVIADMLARYDGGLGLDVAERGNYWAAYSAVTETIDHNLGVAPRRDYVDYALFGAGSAMRSAAFEAALAA